MSSSVMFPYNELRRLWFTAVGDGGMKVFCALAEDIAKSAMAQAILIIFIRDLRLFFALKLLNKFRFASFL